MNKCCCASVAFLILSLLLVACSADHYKCNDPLGCLEISSGCPIVIGSLLETFGEQNPVGIKTLEGVRKAVADQDELLGHPIELISYGMECTAESTWSAATEFSTNPKLLAVIGPTCADEAKTADTILSDAGIPMLGPVTDPEAAYELTNRVFAAIVQVAVQAPDKILYVPRQTLLDALSRVP